MNRQEILELTGIPRNTWDDYIRKGIIAKEKQGQYSPSSVIDQVFKYHRKLMKEKDVKLGVSVRKINELERKLAVAESRTVGTGDPNSPDDEIPISKPRTMKEKVDVQLAQRRIRKMDMDEQIRTKKHIPIELFTELVGDIATTAASKLNPIPMLVKRTVPELPAATYDKLVGDITKLRNDLAAYDGGDTIDKFLDNYEPKGFFDDEE